MWFKNGTLFDQNECSIFDCRFNAHKTTYVFEQSSSLIHSVVSKTILLVFLFYGGKYMINQFIGLDNYIHTRLTNRHLLTLVLRINLVCFEAAVFEMTRVYDMVPNMPISVKRSKI